MILLLGVVAVLYSLWGKAEDTIAIFGVIASVVLVEVYTEFRAKAAIAALKQLSAPTAPVLRDGRIASVPTEAVVPGDVVIIRAGERLPADVRLIDATDLHIDESALTGESVPADKHAGAALAGPVAVAERRTMAFAGTAATSGRGRGVVTAIGMDSELGRIAGLVREAKDPRTPLQQAMRRLAGSLARLALAISVVVPAIGLLGGQPVRDMVLTGLTLAFATVPEELPIIITMVLGFGAWRLSRRHALVKRLAGAETLGSVSVIATDKTGTLTENRMTVSHLWTGTLCPVGTVLEPAERHLVELAGRCLDAEVVGTGATLQVAGDPMERAVATLADGHGLLGATTVAREYGFDSTRKLMSVVYADGDGGGDLVAKGAPEALLARATGVVIDGAESSLAGGRVAPVEAAVAAMTAEGLRVIAVASRRGLDRGTERDDAERDLTLAGLLGLSDPARPEAKAAVEALRGGGVRVLMLTGDHPATAAAVARAVGLDGDGRPIVRGADVDEMGDADLDVALGRSAVFARLAPEHKLRIVRALRRQGEVVAVTGDGVNDAPALVEADVGVAMGTGTDVAKEAADVVLADNNFATVAEAVREGRHLFDNLRKGVRFYLACKLALVVTSAAGVLVGLPVPFAPIQIVVMELFMDIAASVTFVAEPAEGDVMARPPRDPQQRFLDRSLLVWLVAGAAALAVPTAGLYLWGSFTDATVAEARTLAFVAWMAGTVALAWVMRSERTPLHRVGLASNRFLPLWTATTALALALFTGLPAARHALRLAPLSVVQWSASLALPVLGATLWNLAAHRSRVS